MTFGSRVFHRRSGERLTLRRVRFIFAFIHSFMTTTTTTLSAYGEELIAACRAYSDAALAVKEDDKDDGARAEPPTAGVASTRGCIDACARIDAEGTKGTHERNPYELTSRTVD